MNWQPCSSPVNVYSNTLSWVSHCFALAAYSPIHVTCPSSETLYNAFTRNDAHTMLFFSIPTGDVLISEFCFSFCSQSFTKILCNKNTKYGGKIVCLYYFSSVKKHDTNMILNNYSCGVFAVFFSF